MGGKCSRQDRVMSSASQNYSKMRTEKCSLILATNNPLRTLTIAVLEEWWGEIRWEGGKEYGPYSLGGKKCGP